MANVQIGYGKGDVLGSPFDYYSGTASIPTGATVTMQNNNLVLDPGGAISITVNLPLNPPDGANAEITNRVGAAGTVTTTVAANTGDSLLGTAATALTAGTTFKYKYSLNGDTPRGINPRTWVRVS